MPRLLFSRSVIFLNAIFDVSGCYGPAAGRKMLGLYGYDVSSVFMYPAFLISFLRLTLRRTFPAISVAKSLLCQVWRPFNCHLIDLTAIFRLQTRKNILSAITWRKELCLTI